MEDDLPLQARPGDLGQLTGQPGGRGAAVSGMVVRRHARPRTAPASPRRRISRVTVQRATTNPSRSSCFHTFRTP